LTCEGSEGDEKDLHCFLLLWLDRTGVAPLPDENAVVPVVESGVVFDVGVTVDRETTAPVDSLSFFLFECPKDMGRPSTPTGDVPTTNCKGGGPDKTGKAPAPNGFALAPKETLGVAAAAEVDDAVVD